MGVDSFLQIILSLSDLGLAVFRERGFVDETHYVDFFTKHTFAIQFVGTGAASAFLYLLGH